MKFETVLKTWDVVKHRCHYKIDLMHDFTIRSTSKYGENLFNPNVFISDWFGFSEDKNQEIEIIIEILSLIPLPMMSPSVKKLALFYANYQPTEIWQNINLRPDQEFFTGPRMHSFSLIDRRTLKNKYILLTSSVLKPTDGFLLFDYSTIQVSREVKNSSGGQDYFKIENGKVTYGGYDNTGNGGEQNWDLESVYYWPQETFNLLTNRSFKTLQAEIQKLFLDNVVSD